MQLTFFPQVGCICDNATCDKIIKQLLPKLALSTQVCGHFLKHDCLGDQVEQLITVRALGFKVMPTKPADTSIERLICSRAWSAPTAQKGNVLVLVDYPVATREFAVDYSIRLFECFHVCQIDWNHPRVVQLAMSEVVFDKCLGA